MPWHEVRDPNDPELDRLAAQYHLHPLHIEDCRHRNQNAKLEELGDYIFVVLKPVDMLADASLRVVDLDVFLGPDFIITVQESECASIGPALDKARAAPAGEPPAKLFYRIVDGLVDTYLPTLDRLADLIDELQDRVLARPDPETLEKIFETKRALIELRRVLTNTRDVAGHLQRSQNKLIPPDLWPFLRDIYDHVARNLDTVEMHRDLLSSALDIYLSSVANRTNQVMKVLTIMGTIALPSIVISGFFGMNTKDLPIVNGGHATALITASQVAGTLVLLGVLKYFGWF